MTTETFLATARTMELTPKIGRIHHFNRTYGGGWILRHPKRWPSDICLSYHDNPNHAFALVTAWLDEHGVDPTKWLTRYKAGRELVHAAACAAFDRKDSR